MREKTNKTNIRESMPKPTGATITDKFIIPGVLGLAFALFAYYFLVICNSDLLYTAQERSFFIPGKEFFDVIVVKPGSFMLWLGCYFTQYFYHPALGGIILTAIWLLIYLLTIKVFRLKGWMTSLALIPVTALLVADINVGYWVYNLKVPGFWFGESLGLLTTLLMLWCQSRLNTARNIPRFIAPTTLCVITAVLYAAAGWWAIVFAIAAALISRFSLPVIISAIVSIAAIPYISYYFCTEMRSNDAWWASFPIFQNNATNSWERAFPYFVIAAVTILLSLYTHIITAADSMNKYVKAIICLAVMAVMAFWAETKNYSDETYHMEMRMYKAASDNDWDGVLKEAAMQKGKGTRETVMLRNMALMIKGTFGTEFCNYDNMTEVPKQADSLQIHLVQTFGPLAYMKYARVNFATRWCMENGVEFGFSNDIYKVLTQCALISGEQKLAQKYIDVLKKTKYHREWAEHFEPMVKDPSLVAKSTELGFQKELYNHYSNVLDSDEGLVEMYLINYFSHTQNKDSKTLQNVTLDFAMLAKDIQLFWPRFFLYATLHNGETMPILYQEAAFLYGQLEHDVDISRMPFDQDLVQRYQAFQQASQSMLNQGMQPEQVGEAMKANYGNTFWWFYFFCRNISSY